MLMTTDLHESKCMYPGVSVDEVDLWIGCCTQKPKKAQNIMSREFGGYSVPFF